MPNTIATVNHGGHDLRVKVEPLQKLVISKNKISADGVSPEQFLQIVSGTEFTSQELGALIEGALPEGIDVTGFGQSAKEQLVANDSTRSAFLVHQFIRVESVAKEAPDLITDESGNAIKALKLTEPDDFEQLSKFSAKTFESLNGELPVFDNLLAVVKTKIADGSFTELFNSLGEEVNTGNAEHIAKVIANRVQEQSSFIDRTIQRILEYNETTIVQDPYGASCIEHAKLIAANKENVLQISFNGKDGQAKFDEFVANTAELKSHVKTQESASVEGNDEAAEVTSGNDSTEGSPPVEPERSDVETPEGENQNKLGKGLGIASIVIGALAALGGIFSSDEGSRGKAVAALIGGILIALPFLKPLHNFFWGKGEGNEDAVPAEAGA